VIIDSGLKEFVFLTLDTLESPRHDFEFFYYVPRRENFMNGREQPTLAEFFCRKHGELALNGTKPLP
jgi:hypothetical protein